MSSSQMRSTMDSVTDSSWHHSCEHTYVVCKEPLRPRPHVPKQSFFPSNFLASFQEYLRPDEHNSTQELNTTQNAVVHIPGL